MGERVEYKKMPRLENSDNSDNANDSAMIQLEMVHSELDKLIEKENDEIIQVEQKYKKLKQQLYEKRSSIVENIPEFWYNIFTSHPDICNVLTEEDEDCLMYLGRLEVDTSDNIKAGYSIKFVFNENPYFKNEVLIKEFSLKQGSFVSTSTKIDWKKPYPSKAECNRNNQGRKRSHPEQNFFDWFANNEDPSNDILAEIIKDDIWPNSLQYFLVPDPDLEGDKDDDSTDSSDMDEAADKGNKQRDAEEGTSSK